MNDWEYQVGWKGEPPCFGHTCLALNAPTVQEVKVKLIETAMRVRCVTDWAGGIQPGMIVSGKGIPTGTIVKTVTTFLQGDTPFPGPVTEQVFEYALEGVRTTWQPLALAEDPELLLAQAVTLARAELELPIR